MKQIGNFHTFLCISRFGIYFRIIGDGWQLRTPLMRKSFAERRGLRPIVASFLGFRLVRLRAEELAELVVSEEISQ